ncbi:DUF938 domain-containing protein [cf. Phormidesmis sp. LEGE 11477]|uniref:DUF938 domain-containing protein n=1 Tax=cf. Phormidesmis sp. LEGE 11477 TaxID=1828680 RepID=UPI00187F18EF|nr:DUF938 domain-containing protein [cf. Phormidesmis sp. LEGE 11477]MBE9061891.1 DUF938 domain-containing protein [cf. Phormidesmis sp. LEGE 11477]
MVDSRRYAPATERNRQPILDVLHKVLPNTGTVLEIASGTGEHATFFAPRLSHLHWLPSEPDPESRASVTAWVKALPSDNLIDPLALDVSQQPWPVEQEGFKLAQPITAIVNINMLHISAWEMCQHLMAGAQRVLPSDGVLYLYGPFKREGQQTAPSNEAFDAMLRDRNPNWGIRDLEAVSQVARKHALTLTDVIPMPANNFSVVFRRD